MNAKLNWEAFGSQTSLCKRILKNKTKKEEEEERTAGAVLMGWD